jgi:thiamine-phosphate pyrophosphorylase
MDHSALSRLRVYLVTDRTQTRGRPLLDVIERALSGGVRAVQLRERDLDTRELTALAHQLRAVTRDHGALLLINDRIDVALACDADGVHLPTHSFTVRDARQLLGAHRLVGVSTHHRAELATAIRDGADFAVFGPVYDTPSKQQYGAPVGLGAFAAAAQQSIPVLAIGGVTREHVRDLRARGAGGVAVIRAILAADDPAIAAREMVREFDSS